MREMRRPSTGDGALRAEALGIGPPTMPKSVIDRDGASIAGSFSHGSITAPSTKSITKKEETI